VALDFTVFYLRAKVSSVLLQILSLIHQLYSQYFAKVLKFIFDCLQLLMRGCTITVEMKLQFSDFTFQSSSQILFKVQNNFKVSKFYYVAKYYIDVENVCTLLKL